MCSFRMTDLMGNIFNMIQISILFDLFDHRISSSIAVHALILSADLIHRSIRIHADWLFQSMSFRNRKIVRIMGWCTLHDCRTKIHIDILIADDRQFLAICRIDAMLPNHMICTFIFGIDHDTYIAEHCFRAGRSDHELFVLFHCMVLHVIHFSSIFLIINLNI